MMIYNSPGGTLPASNTVPVPAVRERWEAKGWRVGSGMASGIVCRDGTVGFRADGTGDFDAVLVWDSDGSAWVRADA